MNRIHLTENTEIDIINFNETWLGKEVLNNQIRLPGYKIYRYDRQGRRKGGGFCTYVRGGLKCDAQLYEQLNVSNEHIEVLVLDIDLPQTKPIIVVNVYRPPSGKINVGLETLQEIVDQLPSHAELFITGDLNIDLSQVNSPSS